jgi:transposase
MNFRPYEPDKKVYFPESYNELVDKDHLSRLVVTIVSLFDLSSIEKKYKGHGKPAYSPLVMIPLLIYGYIVGITSARKLAEAIKERLSFKYICAGAEPHHSTISRFRQRFLPEIEDMFKKVLEFANLYGLVDLTNCYADGTKMLANASKHHAYSYGRAVKLKEKYEQEIRELKEQQDKPGGSDYPSINIQDEIKLRQKKLANVVKAIDRIVERAFARYQADLREYEEKMAARDQKKLETGTYPSGKPPSPPKEGPDDKDQSNLTDHESRIMLNSSKGFSQAYNAQAVAEGSFMIVVAGWTSQNPNDKQEVETALKEFVNIPDSIGKVDNLGGDCGYYSEDNIVACEKAGINPYFAVARTRHHKSMEERFSQEEPLPLRKDATPAEKMRYKLDSPEGKKIYAKRKQVIEPVFGIIKSVMKTRQFRLRGKDNANNEWKFICMCYNIKKFIWPCTKHNSCQN